MEFTKWHGIGNDFILIDMLDEEYEITSALATKLCNRHTGIGGDGVILMKRANPAIADLTMEIYNADGSIAEMCGNAIRCVAAYIYGDREAEKKLRINTLDGIKLTELLTMNDNEAKVRVNMGVPGLTRGDIGIMQDSNKKATDITISYGNNEYVFTGISMGNPHIVNFVNNISKIDLEKIGPYFEKHPLFSEKTNVEFAEIISSDLIRMRVWERGVGITYACGTGACATFVAAVINGYGNERAELKLDGGSLFIEWNGENTPVYMTGSAVKVFEGRYL